MMALPLWPWQSPWAAMRREAAQCGEVVGICEVPQNAELWNAYWKLGTLHLPHTVCVTHCCPLYRLRVTDLPKVRVND